MLPLLEDEFHGDVDVFLAGLNVLVLAPRRRWMGFLPLPPVSLIPREDGDDGQDDEFVVDVISDEG